MLYNGFSIDIEANGFVFGSTEIWTVSVVDLDTEDTLRINPFRDKKAKDKLEKWVSKYECPNIVFHNGLGYDIFVMMFLMGIEYGVGPDTFMGYKVNFVDTFYLSMFLNPDREKHSLEHLGEVVGMSKIDFRQKLIEAGALDPNSPEGSEFNNHHPLMDTYCDRDALVAKLVFIFFISEWISLYKTWDSKVWPSFFKAGQKSFYLMSCQELSGWKFDLEKGMFLKSRIESMQEEIRAEVEPQLPPRSLKKSEESYYTFPAKPFKKDGTLSSTMEKWLLKHGAEFNPESNTVFHLGKSYDISTSRILDVKLPMEMANQDQMKDWFISLGWKPTLFNFKKDQDGKPVRDPKTRQLILTTPKLQEAGKLCTNLEKLEGPLVKKVVKWLSLRNRLSVLTSWIENDRIKYDGRIGAGRTGIASTHRQKHKVVVNVPKADPKVLLGYEFRELWTSEDGMLIAAGDAAALEGRVQGHYVWKYDGGVTADELLKGDVHCYSEDTEILTEHGWRRFNDVTGIKVAQYDGGSISFVYPSDYIWQEYSGDMVSFNSKSLDMLVTPNHRMLVKSFASGDEFIKLAGEISNVNADLRMHTSGNRIGGVSLSVDELNLIAAIQSDAYLSNCAVRFQFKKQRKIDLIVGILSRLGIEHSVSVKDTTRFYINFSQLGDILKYIDEDKNLDYKLLELDPNSLKVLLFCYGNWDGTFKKNGDVVVDTTSRKTVDVLQACASLCGVKITITNDIVRAGTYNNRCVIHRAYISRVSNPVVRTFGTKSVINYSGKIGCVTVESGFIIVRRNGRVQVSGNSKNSNAFYGNIYPEVSEMYNSPDFDKENPNWKPYRSKSKNGFYAILYGASAPKVASTLGIPEKYGKVALDSFWEANPGTALLKSNLEKYWESTGKCKYLPAIDGRILLTRKKSALLNTIFQSCGGIIMDYAGCYMDSWLGGLLWDDLRRPYYSYKGYIVRRIGYFHDELEYECQEQVVEEVARMIEKAISKAGEHLGIKLPIVGEGKVGKNWKEVH